MPCSDQLFFCQSCGPFCCHLRQSEKRKNPDAYVQYVLPGFGDLKVSRSAMQTWPFSVLSVRGIWQARGFPALPYCEFYIRLQLQDSSCKGNHSLIFLANFSLWDMSLCLSYPIFIPSYCSKQNFPLSRLKFFNFGLLTGANFLPLHLVRLSLFLLLII